jgi:hypothetical protein
MASEMTRTIYTWTRGLHLYLGLFLSPFVVVFAISVFCLNHNWFPGGHSETLRRTVPGVRIPEGIEKLQGRERVDAIRPLLDRIGVRGEIGFVNWRARDGRLIVPVALPGQETVVDVDLRQAVASIETTDTGAWNATVYLHKSPGPHNVALRGNWWPTRVWGWFADGVVYIVLFLSLSGIYLWTAMRAERRTGLLLLCVGALSFVGLIYALL